MADLFDITRREFIHTFGRGRTLLIASFPGAEYLHHGAATKDLIALR